MNSMRWMTRIAIAFLLAANSLSAGQFNEVLSIGDAAPAWQGLPGSDGKDHSLSDFKDKDAVVVVFTCLSCPTAIDYEERINQLAQKYGGASGKVGIAAICVNRITADRLDRLTEHANAQKLAFTYLYDESQKIAKDFGAIYTPEFYVLNKERKIVYMGAMDDATEGEVKSRFVEDAVVATLNGKTIATTETIARGCRVRYARERK